MKAFSALFLVSLLSFSSIAQEKESDFHGFANISGMFQTGNLNQYSGNVIARASISKEKYEWVLSGSYIYVNVNDFNVINDNWNYGIFKLHPKNRIYSVAMVYEGFAKSFGLDNDFLAGLGTGFNVVNKSSINFLNVNLTAGYLDFNYMTVEDVQTMVTNINVNASAPLIKDKLKLNWEFHAYFSPIKKNIHGYQNNLRFMIPITKNLEITLSNRWIYSQRTDVFKKKLNTISQVGISIKK